MKLPELTSIAVSSLIPPSPSSHSVLIQLLKMSLWYVFMASPHSGVVVFKLLPILLAHVAYGSKGSDSSITNSLFAPVFFRMLSRISSKFSSRNLSRFTLLYDTFIMYAFSGMFVLVNLIVVLVVCCSFDMSSIETSMFPVAVFNFYQVFVSQCSVKHRFFVFASNEILSFSSEIRNLHGTLFLSVCLELHFREFLSYLFPVG